MQVLAKLVAIITRRFYPRGTQRVLKFFFNPKKFWLKTVISYDKSLKINIDTSSYVEWEIFFQGYYERWVINLMKKVIAEGDVVMDVGANIGTHTLVMSKLVGESGRVLVFDPDPPSLRRLKENVNLNNLSNIKILEIALSDLPGMMKLYSYSDEMSDHGTASLYELPKLEKTEISVSVSTIDEVVTKEKLSRLDFIKIDTRGSDFPAIRGAHNSLQRLRPFIVFEFNKENWTCSGSEWEDMRRLLDSNSYIIYLVLEDGLHLINDRTKEKTSYNILAVPKEKLNQISPLCREPI